MSETHIPQPIPVGDEWAGDYYFDDIATVLPADDVRAFSEWLRGQTCGVGPHGAVVVYAYDWERWQRRHPVRAWRQTP